MIVSLIWRKWKRYVAQGKMGGIPTVVQADLKSRVGDAKIENVLGRYGVLEGRQKR